jgi:hypothetical protein
MAGILQAKKAGHPLDMEGFWLGDKFWSIAVIHEPSAHLEPRIVAGADLLCKLNQGPSLYNLLYFQVIWVSPTNYSEQISTTDSNNSLGVFPGERSNFTYVRPQDYEYLVASRGFVIIKHHFSSKVST